MSAGITLPLFSRSLTKRKYGNKGSFSHFCPGRKSSTPLPRLFSTPFSLWFPLFFYRVLSGVLNFIITNFPGEKNNPPPRSDFRSYQNIPFFAFYQYFKKSWENLNGPPCSTIPILRKTSIQNIFVRADAPFAYLKKSLLGTPPIM